MIAYIVLILWASITLISAIENDNQIQSISDVKKSVENVKTDKNDIQSSVAVIKIQDKNFTKFLCYEIYK